MILLLGHACVVHYDFVWWQIRGGRMFGWTGWESGRESEGWLAVVRVEGLKKPLFSSDHQP